jgi:hypothetical protein
MIVFDILDIFEPVDFRTSLGGTRWASAAQKVLNDLGCVDKVLFELLLGEKHLLTSVLEFFVESLRTFIYGRIGAFEDGGEVLVAFTLPADETMKTVMIHIVRSNSCLLKSQRIAKREHLVEERDDLS